MCILGKRLKAHQTSGFFINLVGVGIIGYVAITGRTGWSTGSTDGVSNALIGFVLAVSACFWGALQSVWEEKVMHQYTIPPELLSGMEGVWGLGFVLVQIFFLNLFHEANT